MCTVFCFRFYVRWSLLITLICMDSCEEKDTRDIIWERLIDTRQNNTSVSPGGLLTDLRIQRKRFSSQGLVNLHCSSCKKTEKKFPGKSDKICSECGCVLSFQCSMCNATCKSHSGVINHIKRKCGKFEN
ncbi:uncharacterized protein LOC106649698 isoform X2 [Trichogramma pretiosum]|uniref:uncharacterized protein LOC106649698 isoform X2 n=1 Tax=Trichogramma pretiosum TaxID=7493 RepID=UPI0006C963B7|nr:uncharacterized protein LOC106649698 isoform X2 [Trichogramma pretiosum]